jgi:hypothetical protein
VLIKYSAGFTGYLLVQTLLDAGAAYGAFTAGLLLGKAALLAVLTSQACLMAALILHALNL